MSEDDGDSNGLPPDRRRGIVRRRSAPLRLLLVSYGAAAIVALIAILAGASALTAALTFWLGGPILVVALATLPWVRARFRRRGHR